MIADSDGSQLKSILQNISDGINVRYIGLLIHTLDFAIFFDVDSNLIEIKSSCEGVPTNRKEDSVVLFYNLFSFASVSD